MISPGVIQRDAMSEFDSYINLPIRENPVKYIMGGTNKNFLKHKALWFLSDLKKYPLKT